MLSTSCAIAGVVVARIVLVPRLAILAQQQRRIARPALRRRLQQHRKLGRDRDGVTLDLALSRMPGAALARLRHHQARCLRLDDVRSRTRSRTACDGRARSRRAHGSTAQADDRGHRMPRPIAGPWPRPRSRRCWPPVASGSAFSPPRQMWTRVLSASVSAARTVIHDAVHARRRLALLQQIAAPDSQLGSVISEIGFDSNVSVR